MEARRHPENKHTAAFSDCTSVLKMLTGSRERGTTESKSNDTGVPPSGGGGDEYDVNSGRGRAALSLIGGGCDTEGDV